MKDRISRFRCQIAEIGPFSCKDAWRATFSGAIETSVRSLKEIRKKFGQAADGLGEGERDICQREWAPRCSQKQRPGLAQSICLIVFRSCSSFSIMEAEVGLARCGSHMLRVPDFEKYYLQPTPSVL